VIDLQTQQASHEKVGSCRVVAMAKYGREETSLDSETAPLLRVSSATKSVKRPDNADEALGAFEAEDETLELDEGENKRLLHLIDMNLIPVSS
jgi:hypothetical protein